MWVYLWALCSVPFVYFCARAQCVCVCVCIQFRGIFSYYFLQKISLPLSISFLDSYNGNVSMLDVFSEFSKYSPQKKFFFRSAWVISTLLSSSLLIHSSVSSNLLLILSNVYFILVIAIFSSVWFFFLFSNSLLNFSLF